MSLIQIDIPSPKNALQKPSRFEVIFAMGFRPLYLLAAIWAALSVALWIYMPQLLVAKMPGVWWHAHEMLWGFIATVAVAFLLTASATWTGTNPMKSTPLALLCGLWLIARLAYLVPGNMSFIVGAVAETSFFVSAAVALSRVLIKAKSKQNYPLVFALLGLAVSNAAYLSMIYTGQGASLRTGFHIGMLLMSFIALLIARRVIPFFAQRGAGLDIPRSEKSGKYQLWITAITLLMLLLGLHTLTGIGLLVLGAITLYQLYTWQPLGVRRVPLLWVLYISYFLLGVGLIVAALYFLPFNTLIFPPAMFVHVIGMGGFAVMIIGMMTRTALGHTGRALKASNLMVIAYVLVITATLLRLAAIIFPVATIPLWHSSALCWVLGFIAYAYEYGPYLTSPRADGRPG